MKRINKKTWSTEADARFAERMRMEGAVTYRGCALMGSILFFSGIFLDWFAARPYFLPLTVLRLTVTFIFIVFFLISKSSSVLRNPYRHSVLLAFAGSASITAMCLIQGGYQSPYYAGISLVMVALGVMFPYNTLQTAGALLVTYFTYWVPIAIQARFQFENTQAFANNLFFLTLTGIIGVVAAYVRMKMKYEIFNSLLQIEKTNHRLTEYDRLKNQFFSNISHELRTPLALILGATDRWKGQKERSAEDCKTLEIIRSNSLVVLKHVNDLLDIAKLEANKMGLKRSVVDIAALVRRITGMFRVLAEQKKIEFIVNTPDSLSVAIDIEKFEKILSNLLSNSLKFVAGESRVVCSLSVRDNRIQLIVEDNGPGIPTDLKQKVFERFYQADSGEARQYGGTGLGLSIVKEFVELHDGSIEFRDPLGGGVQAVVELPVVLYVDEKQTEEVISLSTTQQTIAQNKDNKPESLVPLVPQDGESPEIFIVEDSYEMRTFLEDALKPHFSIASFSSAIDALAEMPRIRPELILSDYMLPELNGKAFFDRLRSDPELKDITFVFLTAKADDEMRLSMIEHGAFDYLLKPFSVQELLARLRNCLMISRAKKILQKELNSSQSNLQELTGEVLTQKHKLELAIKSAIVARDDALESSQIKSRFLSLISHELRTPLSTIHMTTEFLSEGGSLLSSTKQTELYENLLRASNSLRDLVETLLQYSKMQKGKFTPKEDLFQVSQLVDRVLQDYRSMAENKSLKIFSKIDEEIFMRGDFEVVRLVISNLVSNAIKYTDQGSVSIEASRDSEQVHIYVKDTGIGIGHSDLGKIFEEFERVSGPHSFVPGLGLGLSLVKALVSSLGGNVAVRSVIGQGSSFEVSFPLYASDFLSERSNSMSIAEGRSL